VSSISRWHTSRLPLRHPCSRRCAGAMTLMMVFLSGAGGGSGHPDVPPRITTSVVKASGFVAVDWESGRLLAGFPRFAGTSRPDLGSAPVLGPMISDGRGGWFLGGTFRSAGGFRCDGIAHVFANWRVDRGWCPRLTPRRDASVDALTRTGEVLFIGGRFRRVNGVRRVGIAAVDTSTGRVRSWHAPVLCHYADLPCGFTATQADVALNVVVHGAAVYITGPFSTVGGERREEYAALDAHSGRLLPWNPQPSNTGPHGIEPEIVKAADALLTSGYFDQIGGEPRANFAALDYVSARAHPLRITARPCFFPDFVAAYGKIYFSTLEIESGEETCRVDAFDAATGLPAQWTRLSQVAPEVVDLPIGAVRGRLYVERFRPGYWRSWTAVVRVDSTGNMAAGTLEVNGTIGAIAAVGGRTVLIGGDFTAARFRPTRFSMSR
jgi:hypothetical protein